MSATEGGKPEGGEGAGPRRFADASRLLLRTTVFGAVDDLAALILAQQAVYRQHGGKFIIPIPEVKVV